MYLTATQPMFIPRTHTTGFRPALRPGVRPHLNLWVGPGLAAGAAAFQLDPPRRFSQVCISLTLCDTVLLVALKSGGCPHQRDTCFITRPCPVSPQMWAGKKVLSIGRVRSPRLDTERMPMYDYMLEVEWHAPCLDNEGRMRIDEEL